MGQNIFFQLKTKEVCLCKGGGGIRSEMMVYIRHILSQQYLEMLVFKRDIKELKIKNKHLSILKAKLSTSGAPAGVIRLSQTCYDEEEFLYLFHSVPHSVI